MKNIYEELLKKECSKWLELDQEPYDFKRWLRKRGWRDINPKMGRGIWKFVLSKDNVVIKFDEEISSNSHTRSEYLSLIHSSKPRRKYICPTLLYFKGLLFQPLLENVCDNVDIVPDKVHRTARKYKFSHYWNYGYLHGKLKFYDTDSLYYVLTDKEERK